MGKSEQEKIYLLLKEHTENLDKTKVAKQVFMKTSVDNRKQMFYTFENWLNLFCLSQKSMIDVVKIFSQRIASKLNELIESYRNNSKIYLKENYWDHCKQEGIIGEELNKFTKQMLDQQMDLAGIDEMFVNTAFVVASDTLKHVGLEMMEKITKIFWLWRRQSRERLNQ